MSRTPQIGEREDYECPSCGGAADATYKALRDRDEDWLISCRKRGCDGQDLPSIAEAFGLDRAATKEQIVAAIRVSALRRRPARPEALPSATQVGWWEEALWSPAGREGIRFLIDECGISKAVIRRQRIGWDAKRRTGTLVMPMFVGGEIVAAKWRWPRRGTGPDGASIKWRSWPRDSILSHPLYPDPGSAQGSGWLLLVAGEGDALSLASRGLPATSVTLGAGQPAKDGQPVNAGPGSPWWRDDWTERLRGRSVRVVFDNGEQTQGAEVVRGLEAAGITARQVDLREVGFNRPKGDVTDFLMGGGNPACLRPRRVVRTKARRR